MPQISSTKKFHFTETAPTPLLEDFDTFTRYLEANAFGLGKAKEFIPYKHLAALNEEMTPPNLENTPRTSQEFYPQWNLAALRSVGFLPTMKEFKKKGKPDFVGLFRPLCAAGELRSALPREIYKEVRGNFVFKVHLGPSVWRLIALSSEHTLHDLHAAIQKAFDFDSDHLYAFYMDNRWYSDERFESPHSSEGISADEVTIGELGLTVNQTFIYHFDFGDDWRFDVHLLEIKTDQPLLKKPEIVETHGKAPAQYRGEEW